MYHYPKALALAILIAEPFLHGKLTYFRSYLGIMFFFYLLLRLGQFWGIEYYRWLGPLIIRTSRNPEDYNPTNPLNQWIYYTDLDQNGNLIVREEKNPDK
jgi:hypothetical protein